MEYTGGVEGVAVQRLRRQYENESWQYARGT
jgi:hypothetical protein